MATAWTALGTPRAELVLSNTLPTGQSFRWRQTGSFYTGVIGQRVVQLRQLPDDVEYKIIARGPQASKQADAAVLSNYLQLDSSLQQLCKEWSARDERFCRICPFLQGCRMLRQDPVECLFQFICSSNNHISRIHGMVARLCSTYGTQLLASSDAADMQQQQQPQDIHPAAFPPRQGPQHHQQQAFYAFPSLEQLSTATEEALRADGFGYRAKFIVGSVQQLLAKPGGGAQWLLSLRDKPYAEAHEALCSLPGIGPKVAACICLFSLDKAEAIPVDTHVWTLATRYYAPQLAGKTLNKKLHDAVQQVFVECFGPYAGWAHNTLFVSELASHKQLLPAGLASASAAAAGGGSKKAGKRGRGKSKAAAAAAASGASGSDADDDGADGSCGEGDLGALLLAEDKGSSVKSRSRKKRVSAAAAVECGAAGDEAGAVAVASDAAAGSRRRSSRARKLSTRYTATAAAAGCDSDGGSGNAGSAGGLVAAFDAAAANLAVLCGGGGTSSQQGSTGVEASRATPACR